MSAPTRLSPASFMKHAADVASFYGFRPMRDIERTVPRIDRIRGAHTFESSVALCAAAVAARTPTASPEPVLAFWASGTPARVPAPWGPREVAEFGLSVVGAPHSLGEIVLLKASCAILQEWGAGVARVRVNALGDRDSKARFERDMGAYLRRRGSDLEPACREKLAGEPGVHVCESETCRAILSEGPRAVNFLSEKSRAHFREVLEHIEHLGLPYELDDLLLGDEREPNVLFGIDLGEADATVVGALGGRFDEYARRATGRKDTSALSASIFFRKKGTSRASFLQMPAQKAPKIYFVQLGERAKLQGLAVLDLLREAGVPVSQSFDAKGLGLQLESARRLGVPYLLIMGQREALDGTVIVRSAQNSSQTILQLSQLPRFLKTLR